MDERQTAALTSLFGLAGKVAVVTGGSSGLGRAIAQGLASVGVRVAVTGTNTERCEMVVTEIRAVGGDALPLIADVADPAQVERLVEQTVNQWGRLDILIASAGIVQNGAVLDMTPEEWRHVLDVDLNGAFYCCQAAGRVMIGQGSGSIITVASLSGMFGHKHEVAYAAAKGGVIQLTRGLAVEWADRGVRVNAIAPTWFYTEMTKTLLDDPASHRRSIAQIPLGRVGHGADIAGVAIFLASDAARFITGQILCVDGGKSAFLADLF
ncbi:MAG: SDR family NAD(P)-dependent oxidoreductase [Thermomicrobiales bacterium]